MISYYLQKSLFVLDMKIQYAGQFYGHTHYDEFLMFYDEIDRKRPVSMV